MTLIAEPLLERAEPASGDIAAFGLLARHEARLAWRDAVALVTGGRRSRAVIAAVVALAVAAFLHMLAAGIIGPHRATIGADKATFVLLTGTAFLAWTLMLSQAMESVTRAFYARADLDLILSSPTSSKLVFTLRVMAIMGAVTLMAVLLFGPFLNVLAWLVHPAFLFGYPVIAAMGALATALAVALTFLMFRWLGAKRTRLAAQVVAAMVGAGFVIGVQAVAILSFGSLSRTAVFVSPDVIAAAPDLTSWIWLPAWASVGDGAALIACLSASLGALGLVIVGTAGAFERNALAAAGVGAPTRRTRPSRDPFRPLSQSGALRRKEWQLLRRDPWLISQSLMQVFYLVPPALLLWINFGADATTLVVISPVIVMAAGQLAGGLAWLAVSGEDAPDLIATAPLAPKVADHAKIEAVLGAVAVPILPILAGLAFAAPWVAAITALGVMAAAAAATAIQLMFRAQAKRAHFRRRQTSSRVATFAEAFASLSIAGAAGLFAAGSLLALAPLAFAGIVLFGAFALSRRRSA